MTCIPPVGWVDVTLAEAACGPAEHGEGPVALGPVRRGLPVAAARHIVAAVLLEIIRRRRSRSQIADCCNQGCTAFV